jgi:conjugal transfer pilus assembly protein TraF
MKKFIVIIGLFLMSSITLANEDFYSQHSVGWHWYDDLKEQEETQKPTNHPAQNDPDVTVVQARQKITTALHKIIAEPTIENLQAYIALQEQLSDRAEKVADLWQQALLKNPKLNYSLTHPTNNVALQVYNDEEAKKKEAAIQAFAQQTGLFFFYRSTCGYCKRFAPIVKHFAEQHGMKIIPISLDGIALPEFPNSKTDSGQAEQFHVSVTPALFAVNPYTNKAYPVAYGLTSETEIRDNIYKIMQQNQNHSWDIR